jgi:hypothetical protein
MVQKKLFATPQTPPRLEICQHIKLYAPLASTVKQPQSTAAATNITVAVPTNAAGTTTTTTWSITSTTNINMIYVLRYKP